MDVNIKGLYDLECYRDLLGNIFDLLKVEMDDSIVSSNKVLSYNSLDNNYSRIRDIVDRQRLDEFVSSTLSRSQNLYNPRFMGHQVPAPLPVSTIMDFLSSHINQGMTIYEMGPWSTASEKYLIDFFTSVIGYGKSAGGVITSGGSIANLTAILAARNAQLPTAWKEGINAPIAILCNADVHYSIVRACGIIGIGENSIVPIPTDDSGQRMCIKSLKATVEDLNNRGVKIGAVVAIAGSTKFGAFDDLATIGEVCKKYGIWFHVDAAHGGAYLLSEKARQKLEGIEMADSVVIDCHKMLYTPALSTMLMYKDEINITQAFSQEASYLFNESSDGELNLGLGTIECTKRAASFSMLGGLIYYGKEFYSDLIDSRISVTKEIVGYLEQHDLFEVITPVDSNIFLFRFCPPEAKDNYSSLQVKIRDKLIRSGYAYLSQAQFGEATYLRAVIINPLTTLTTFKEVVDAIIEIHSCEFHIFLNK